MDINLTSDIMIGLTVPFIGTTLGAAAVFCMKQKPCEPVARALTGFAAGVMVAASVWSLILPAIARSASMGALAFFPAFAGFWGGVMFLLLLDRLIPRLYRGAAPHGDPKSSMVRTVMMALAVTLHNIPEGMAVGVVYAGLIAGVGDITAGGAFALAAGIAIQNFPEGAIISMPLCAQGKSKSRAFVCGAMSGAVEPLFGFLTILFAGLIAPAMPYLLSFAAGAMVYVVVEELIPEMSQGVRSHIGSVFFSVGFTLMMALDVALG